MHSKKILVLDEAVGDYDGAKVVYKYEEEQESDQHITSKTIIRKCQNARTKS